jgi:DNA-binding CsgD family transcriptional regulator
MEDARTIILPPDAVVGDDFGVRQTFELFAAAAGATWAELELRAGPASRRQKLTWGAPSGPTTTIELATAEPVEAVVRLGGGSSPAPEIVDLFTACLEREFGRLCLLAESGLLRSALDATSSAVLLFGPAGTIVYANRPADRLLSRQTEEELTVDCNGEGSQPLFRLLFAQVERMLAGPALGAWRSGLELSDGTEFTSEVVALETGAAGLGRVVLVVLREAGLPPNRRVDDFAVHHRLSPREREVLRLLVQGLDTGALAERLGISPHTVRDHLKHVFRKTSCRSRSELLSSITSGAGGAR